MKLPDDCAPEFAIRDDSPLPDVIANVYEAQSKMRALIKQATTVITLATQLHAIATGNMTPCYTVKDGPSREFLYGGYFRVCRGQAARPRLFVRSFHRDKRAGLFGECGKESALRILREASSSQVVYSLYIFEFVYKTYQRFNLIPV